MSCVEYSSTTFFIRVVARLISSAGFVNSVLAMSIAWLIPSLKTSMPRIHRLASPKCYRCLPKSTCCRPSILSLDPESPVTQASGIVKRPGHNRHVSFHHTPRCITQPQHPKRKSHFRSASYHSGDSTDCDNNGLRSSISSVGSKSTSYSSSSGDLTASEGSTRRTPFLPSMRRALSGRMRTAGPTQGMSRSRTSPAMEIAKSAGGVGVVFSNPFPMSRSRTTAGTSSSSSISSIPQPATPTLTVCTPRTNNTKPHIPRRLTLNSRPSAPISLRSLYSASSKTAAESTITQSRDSKAPPVASSPSASYLKKKLSRFGDIGRGRRTSYGSAFGSSASSGEEDSSSSGSSGRIYMRRPAFGRRCACDDDGAECS